MMEFSGERFIPSKSPKRIEDDHIERYVFASKFIENKSVLDIACGVGYGTSLLAESRASFVLGVDICPSAISYAKTKYKNNNVDFQTGDIGKFQTQTKYDVVVCFETIEHVINFKLAVSNLYCLLKDGGILFISSPNRIVTSPSASNLYSKPKNKHHCQEFTISELSNLLFSHGFIIKNKNIFGQRQYDYPFGYENQLDSFDPKLNTSPKVKVVTNLIPRYFVIVAFKT